MARLHAVKEDPDPHPAAREPGIFRRSGRWFMHSRATGWPAMVLVFLLAVAALYLAVTPSPETPVATPAPESAPVDPAIVQPAVTGCPEQPAVPVAPEALVLAAYDTQWVRMGDQLVPQSEAATPANADAPRSCWPRTPEGALYSGVAFFQASQAAADAQVRIALIQSRASRSGAYGQLLAQLQADPLTATASGSVPDVRVVGYLWSGYSPDVAQYRIEWMRTSGASVGQTVAMTVNLVWEANDWMVVVPGQDSQIYSSVGTSVFTPWGPPS